MEALDQKECKHCKKIKLRRISKRLPSGDVYYVDESGSPWAGASKCPECYREARKLKRKRPKNKKQCLNCNKEFSGTARAKYCSGSCRVLGNRKL